MEDKNYIKMLLDKGFFTEEQKQELFKTFPEFVESEDERIRKVLVDMVKRETGFTGFPSQGQVLAYLEKQKNLDKMIVVSPEVWDNAISDAYENGKGDSEKQKEQKPAESISQLIVQGKGVYKICPRCKERMIRDDSMVYTSMPPQYIYECPKCGERECDTVMYDSPVDEKQKEQKPWKVGANAYFTPEQKPVEFTHHETNESLKDAVTHWSPSEKQMKALEDAFRKDGSDEYRKTINSLYQDLKKL